MNYLNCLFKVRSMIEMLFFSTLRSSLASEATLLENYHAIWLSAITEPVFSVGLGSHNYRLRPVVDVGKGCD